ncbi:hypothetical protein [Paenibacillus glycinis]|uniref:VanZ-like domain-containing protein n=1 Tax=Paenibacillus glycinis TaxID=2697035 RepID=A0ABW9XP62_9BACL|nr:hypothetical protein [Paenibacillus glycinis]NBD24221.1 hypothetical protein [Paenibacillus glycinis]
MNDHSAWYIGLIVISVALLVFTVLRTGNKRSLLLYLGMSGLGYTIEFVIFILFECYAYEPKLIREDGYYDSLAGAIVSNALILPAVAVFLAVLRMGWVPIILAIAAMSGVEYLFLRIGIYEHYWWRTVYTAIGLVVYFWAAKYWFGRIMRPLRGAAHALTLYLILWAMTSPQALEIILLHGRTYGVRWFADQSHDNIAFSSSYCVVLSIIFTWLLCRRTSRRWSLYVVGTVAVLIIDMLLDASGVLASKGWWDYAYRVVTMFLTLWMGDMINKRLRSGPMPRYTR